MPESCFSTCRFLRNHPSCLRFAKNSKISRSTRLSVSRIGFSLIELIVVLGIISILMGLLLPAVQMVRESARQRSCMNHCRQFAIANQNYAGIHQKFPRVWSNARWDSPDYTADRGLFVVLLPYLEMESLYHEFDVSTYAHSPVNQAARAKVPSFYQCPSGLGLAELQNVSERFDGTGIAGNLSRTMDYTGAGGVDAGLLPSNARTSSGATGARLAEIRDGLSNTILGWESSGDRFYRTVPGDTGPILIATDFPGMRGICIAETYGVYCTTKPASVNAFLFSWAGWGAGTIMGYSPDGALIHPNQPGVQTINKSNVSNAPFSQHPGGVHVWMGDGSTRFVSEEIDSQVLSLAVIIADGQINEF
ncbi:MAG: DUF1559 domain-containing protein [Pirellulaceae bacterium]|nr:DUF1559 domain-containing protein [Pirellulaceae bacterium]